jgi:hypothetical protein
LVRRGGKPVDVSMGCDKLALCDLGRPEQRP